MKISLAFLLVLFISPLTFTSSRGDDAAEKPAPGADKAELITLTGTVIQKPWTKSYESWNAGGSEYFVLKVEGELPPERRTAAEGVILRPSDDIPLELFEKLVGKKVQCQGVFVAGSPVEPPKKEDPDAVVEQRPVADLNILTGEIELPVRGSGFKVLGIKAPKS